MNSALPIRAFQWDLARQVERLDYLLPWLPRYADWGYQELYLHLEDAVEYPSLPGVARADAYTRRQFARLVDAATAAGIRVVPIVNLLGHTQYLVKVPALRDLNELRAPDGAPLERGQICPLHPRTPEIAEKLLRDLAPFCTAGKVHVGLDESFSLGCCPRCRAEVARHGLAVHFANHVGRLHDLTRALGLRLGLWADMLALLPAAIPRLPRDVIAYDWYYHPFSRHPRVELHNFAEADLATPLQARGIEYWGCPMNGAFRHEPLPVFGERLANIISWWQRCRRVGAGGLLVTSWEPNRLAVELTAAVDAAAASLWLEPERTDPAAMLRRGFERAFGSRAGAAARSAWAADRHAFCGYPRWQINDRWDVSATREGIRPYRAERRSLEKLRPAGVPALTASLAFRRYLAQRDVFVRRSAAAVFRLRRLLAGRRDDDGHRLLATMRREAAQFATRWPVARAAARIMWRRSRDPRRHGPNDRMLAADARRLQAWRRWLRRAGQRPAIARRATPVCGAWQLQFTVHNFAPALQRVVIEQRQADGRWRGLHGLHLIEFRAAAARPRAKIHHEISVPVDDPRRPLRIGIRGVGEAAVSQVALTDGVNTLDAAGWPRGRRKIIGRPAPRQGLPRVDFARNAGGVALRFPAINLPGG